MDSETRYVHHKNRFPSKLCVTFCKYLQVFDKQTFRKENKVLQLKKYVKNVCDAYQILLNPLTEAIVYL